MKVYVDDMLVKSLCAEDHLTHLAEMFNILFIYGMKLNLSKCAFKVSLGKFLGFMVNHRRIEANSDRTRVVLEMDAPRLTREV